MKLSARNVLKATVTAVKKGLVNAEVDLELAGGTKLASIITLSSAESLGLAEGKSVYAVIKASNIMVAESCGKISARNAIPCTVTAVKEGKVNAEIDLDTTGAKMASIITLTSAQTLGLSAGKSVTAIIKATDVLVGIDD